MRFAHESHAQRARRAAALSAGDALDGLVDLCRALDAPRALRDHGLDKVAIPEAVRAILPDLPPGNPAPVTPEIRERLVYAAWEGTDPR